VQDARAFVRALAGCPTGLDARVVPCCFDHIVMNLPASAVEFLDALSGAFAAPAWAGRALPLVHCYAFLRDNETEDDLRKVRHQLLNALSRGLMTSPCARSVSSWRWEALPRRNGA
jgi:tRNA (guanine37-N1)-methyltransferase